MRLVPGTVAIVKLDGEEYRLTLVSANGGSDGRLNVKAPLAVLLGAMAVDDTVQGWISMRGAEPMQVELVKVEVMP